MMLKKMLITAIILTFLLMPIAFASDGNYFVTSVKMDMTVNDDGSLLIVEEYLYEIEGSIPGIQREIPLKGNQSITDVSIETPGCYNDVLIENSSSTKMTVWFYNDEAKTEPVENRQVQVKYTYNFNKALTVYDDCAQLDYYVWGKGWANSVDNLESNIHIKDGKDNVNYTNIPEDYIISSQWSTQDTLTTRVADIPAYTPFEQYLTIPKDYFKSTDNAQVMNMNAKEDG
ncbi:MAG: hypothetical protein BZ138_00060 [Methanosphaera sp. rholeuAM270]|nr:MAG: hypothetical protein BZ138_00060 [Methanosphaera sp. rholeuAM270]